MLEDYLVMTSLGVDQHNYRKFLSYKYSKLAWHLTMIVLVYALIPIHADFTECVFQILGVITCSYS